MKNFFPLLAFLFCANGLSAQMQISLETLATGFDNPVDIAHCGDQRLFIVERSGTIRVIDESGSVLPTPFLDIESQVNDQPNEQGLLGLAFHPDYLNNGLFFINYNINNQDSRVSKFKVSDTDPNVADEASEEVLMDVGQPFWNHNGGCMKFGPDGYLYISFGDGGSGGDPQNNGQKRTTLLGKMLRIDVDGGSPYAIPPDNPFVDDPNTLDEIWALGLRNVWRFSFDRVTGDMWMADVGQNDWEEVNFQPADSPGGENYGWRCYEGDHPYNTNNCPPMNELVFPVMEYSNSFTEGCSVTGGFVYRGCEFPEMYGHHIFADYCSGKFWRITPDGNGGWENEELANLSNNQVSAFGENVDGQLFVAQHGNGQIAKVVPTADLLTATDESCAGIADGAIEFTIPIDQFATVNWSDGATEANRTDLVPGDYGVTVTTVNGCEFEGTGSVADGIAIVPPDVTIDGDTLLSVDPGADDYQWYFNGNEIMGADENTYLVEEPGDYYVVINEGDCEAVSSTVTIEPNNVFDVLGLTGFALSPNPFGTELRLEISSPQKMDFEIAVTDLNGKTFLRQQKTLHGTFAETFDLSTLPSGVYFFNIKTERGEWSERVVKK